MKDKRILITGGAGLIGSHIADLRCAEQPREIIILDNFVRGRRENLRQAAARCSAHDRRGRHPRPRAARQRPSTGVDIVFHQAAIRITQCAEEPRLALDVLVDGTFNVLEAAVTAGVSKVVAASSASVLGLAESFPTTEAHHPYNNRTIYGAAKAFNEGLLRSFAEMYGLQLRRAALLQRLRPAHGRPRRLHRGAHPLDGAHRRRPGADHLRRRQRRRWTSSMCTTSRAPTSWRRSPTSPTRCSTSPAGRKPAC